MARVLVTGAGGFVGRNVARFLMDTGHDVLGTVHHRIPDERFRIQKCNLTDVMQIDDEFDVIVHTAGSLPYNTTDFLQYKRNNIDSMANLLDFARRKNIKRFIFMSTIGIYGEFREKVIKEESDKINPDAYGLTKYVAECLLRTMFDIEGVSLRMPGIIGESCNPVWLTNTIEKFRTNQEVSIYNPEFRTNNFVWIDDLVSFVDKLIRLQNWKYDAINVACAESNSIREIIDKIIFLTRSKSIVKECVAKRPSFCLDNHRALEMGYESLTPVQIVEKYMETLNNK